MNKGGRIGEYITEYNATTSQQIDGKLIQNLSGPIHIAVSGTDLFILSNHTISELDLTTRQVTPFISGLNASDIAAFEGQLFVTNVSNHSVDVFDIATKTWWHRLPGCMAGLKASTSQGHSTTGAEEGRPIQDPRGCYSC